MKLSKNMAKTAAITIVLLMASVMLMAMPAVEAQAQTLSQEGQLLPPDQVPATAFRVKTIAYLSFRPNPVGVNQIFLVNMWITPALHARRRLTNYTVTIQKPDGDTKVIKMKSYYADATAWFEYIADQEGTWKIKFEFPGNYFPKGNVSGGFMEPSIVTIGECYYEPSSTGWQELVVKKDYVALSWPPSPLPTDYWTRPVYVEHREWVSIMGDWPWWGPAKADAEWNARYPNTNTYRSDRYDFTPYVQGPNSAHIVWKRKGAIAGLAGAMLDEPVEAFRAGGGNPSIVYQGICYQTVTRRDPAGTGSKTYWISYDLRTGETYWEIPLASGESAPTLIEYDRSPPETPGAEARAGARVRFIYIKAPTSTTAGRIVKYDPWTGRVVQNLTGPPPGVSAGTYYMNAYVLSIQDLGAAKAPNRYRLINWTTLDTPPWAIYYQAGGAGAVDDFKQRIAGNVSWPWSSLGTAQDFSVGIAVLQTAISPPEMRAWYGINLQAADLKKGGSILWNVTEYFPVSQFSASCTVADHGKVAVCTVNGFWVCYDLKTGQKLWTSEKTPYPWGIWWAYDVGSAYGMIYAVNYVGVTAINWTNGKIVWIYKYPTPYPYETPYVDENGQGVYSFRGDHQIADGKVYTYNTEHTPSAPITRGWRLHCIDAFTGEGIWSILGEMSVGAIVDGYLVASSTSDGYTYCFGKGKSQTTVSVSQDVVSKGSTVLVKGTVLDMSPAQPGTPCVAKESMSTWMEYLHMQQPINGLFGNETIKGVPVKLTAIREDGKVIDLGTVTTNGYYGTFGFAWTPEEEGTYTVIASFAGDDSYGSSSAATVITVGPAPPTPETPEIPTPTDYTPMLTGLTIAVVIAIIIGIYSIYDHRRLMRK